jgi:hypothetical protein
MRICAMTPEAADQRILRSRKTHSLIAQAFSADDLAAPMHEYIKQLGAEVVILRQLAVEHPGKAHEIGNLVDRYEGLMRQMRGKMD